MIERIESKDIKMSRFDEEHVVLSIDDVETMLTIDYLEQLMKVTDAFWSHNNLWHLTSQAKLEREMCRVERIGLNQVPAAL